MKKLIVTVCLAVLMVNCTEDLVWEPLDPQIDEPIHTRSSYPGEIIAKGEVGKIPPYIKQIHDMPVYFRLNPDAITGGQIGLKVDGNKIYLAKGVSRLIMRNDAMAIQSKIVDEKSGLVLSSVVDKNFNPAYPIMEKEDPIQIGSLSRQVFDIKSNDGVYTISNPLRGLNLTATSFYSTNLVYSSDYSPHLAYWNIVPVQDFEVLNIEYDFVDGEDYYEIIETRKGIDPFNNPPGWGPQVYTYSYTETVSNKSSFSRTEAQNSSITLSEGQSFSHTVPDFGVTYSNTLNLNNTAQWSQQLVFGQETSTSKTVQRSSTWSIPAGVNATFYVVHKEKKARVTYIATLRGITTRDIVKTIGKWEGSVEDLMHIEAIDNTGATMELSKYEIAPTDKTYNNIVWVNSENEPLYFSGGFESQFPVKEKLTINMKIDYSSGTVTETFVIPSGSTKSNGEPRLIQKTGFINVGIDQSISEDAYYKYNISTTPDFTLVNPGINFSINVTGPLRGTVGEPIGITCSRKQDDSLWRTDVIWEVSSINMPQSAINIINTNNGKIEVIGNMPGTITVKASSTNIYGEEYSHQKDFAIYDDKNALTFIKGNKTVSNVDGVDWVCMPLTIKSEVPARSWISFSTGSFSRTDIDSDFVTHGMEFGITKGNTEVNVLIPLYPVIGVYESSIIIFLRHPGNGDYIPNVNENNFYALYYRFPIYDIEVGLTEESLAEMEVFEQLLLQYNLPLWYFPDLF